MSEDAASVQHSSVRVHDSLFTVCFVLEMLQYVQQSVVIKREFLGLRSLLRFRVVLTY